MPPLSPNLGKMLADQPNHLAPDSPSTWTCPPNVPATLRLEANNRLAVLTSALASKPSQGLMAEWLGSLGSLVAGQMPAAEATQRLRAYVAMLDHPAFCFTADTLKDAARRFKWFPSFAEIAEFFDGIRDAVKREKYRCEQIVKRRGESVSDRGQITADERAKVVNGFQQLLANFGKGPADI